MCLVCRLFVQTTEGGAAVFSYVDEVWQEFQRPTDANGREVNILFLFEAEGKSSWASTKVRARPLSILCMRFGCGSPIMRDNERQIVSPRPSIGCTFRGAGYASVVD